jgi:hypothetical protein
MIFDAAVGPTDMLTPKVTEITRAGHPRVRVVRRPQAEPLVA